MRMTTKSRGWKSAWLLLILALTLMPGLALADEDDEDETGPDYASTGIYIGAGFAMGFDQYDGNMPSIDYSPGYGFDIVLGYRVHRFVGIEASYEYLDAIDGKSGSPDVKTGLQTFSANVKGYLPIERFQPYLLGGIGTTKLTTESGPDKSTDSGLSFRAGGGLDYYLTESFALGVQASYLMPVCSHSCDYPYISLQLGGQWKF